MIISGQLSKEKTKSKEAETQRLPLTLYINKMATLVKMGKAGGSVLYFS